MVAGVAAPAASVSLMALASAKARPRILSDLVTPGVIANGATHVIFGSTFLSSVFSAALAGANRKVVSVSDSAIRRRRWAEPTLRAGEMTCLSAIVFWSFAFSYGQHDIGRAKITKTTPQPAPPHLKFPAAFLQAYKSACGD